MKIHTLRYLQVIMVTVLAGCVTDDITLRVESLETQISELERRVEGMEAEQDAAKKERAQTIAAPCPKRAALQGRITGLLNRRAVLLIKYTEKHPDIVELDRQIRLAQEQIKALDAPDGSCGGTPATQSQ